MTEQEKSEEANKSQQCRGKDRLPTVVLGCLTIALR